MAKFLNVYLESDFRYNTVNAKQGLNENDLKELLEQELLQYKLFFEQGRWLDTEIKHIADELEKTGKLFAKNQGFGEGLSIGQRDSGRLKILGTGNLVNGIHAQPQDTKNGWVINFWNDAKNERNEYYAGHMEYGFHDRGGNFVPARPFMRPALYAVAEGSKGHFKNIMQGLLGNLWTGKGFQGVSHLTFGTQSMSPQSNFWSNKINFTERLEAKSNIGQLKGDKHRKWMSTMRPSNPNSLVQKPGYRLSANRGDFQTLRSQSGKSLIKQQRTYKKASGSTRKKPNKTTNKSNKVPRRGLKYTNREKFNEFHNQLLKQRLDAQRKITTNKIESARKAREERAKARQQRIRERDEKRFKQNRPGKRNRNRPGKQKSEKVSITTMENKNGKFVFSSRSVSKDSLNELYTKVTVFDGRVSSIQSMSTEAGHVIVRLEQRPISKKSRKDVYIRK